MDELPQAVLRLVLKQVMMDKDAAMSARLVCKLWAAEILSLVSRVILGVSHLPGPYVTSLAPLARLTALEVLLGTRATEPVDLAAVSGLQHLTQLNLIADSAEVSSLSALVHLRHLSFQVDGRFPDGVAALTALESLVIQVLRVAPDISFLTALAQLDTLTLQCDILAQPQAPDLNLCSCLKTLELENCKLWPFPALPSGLTTLHLTYRHVQNRLTHYFEPRGPLLQLRQLLLSDCNVGPRAARFALIEWCPGLEVLTIQTCDSLLELGGLASLNSLQYSESSVGAISGLGDLPALHRLSVESLPLLSTLRGLQRCTALEYLTVESCDRLVYLPDFGALTALRAVQLRHLGSLEALPELGQLHLLSALEIFECGGLSSIPGLGELSGLRDLRLDYLDSLMTLAGLDQLTSLTVLRLQLWSEGLVLVNVGVVQIFNRLLASGSSIAKYFVALSLWSVTLDEESKTALITGGGIRQLVEMLKDSSEETRDTIASALCNTCWEGDNDSGRPNEAMARAVVEAGALPLLLHLFEEPEHRHTGLVGMANLAILQDVRAKMITAGVPEKLIASILESENVELFELGTLGRLCLDEWCVVKVWEARPLVEKVVELFKACTDERRRFAFDLLQNCNAASAYQY